MGYMARRPLAAFGSKAEHPRSNEHAGNFVCYTSVHQVHFCKLQVHIEVWGELAKWNDYWPKYTNIISTRPPSSWSIHIPTGYSDGNIFNIVSIL